MRFRRRGSLVFAVYGAADGWRWRASSANGLVVADSGQAYAERRDAVAGARLVAAGGHVVHS